jgi:hypothetical protein
MVNSYIAVSHIGSEISIETALKYKGFEYGKQPRLTTIRAIAALRPPIRGG